MCARGCAPPSGALESALSGAWAPDSLELELAGGRVELWVAEPAQGTESLDQAVSWLSAEERERCSRAIDPASRERRLLARASLRRILGARLDLAPREVRLASDERGRPLLRSAARIDPRGPEPHELSLSISYGGAWIAVAIGHGVSVGVDIEPRARRVPAGVIARVLHPGEREPAMVLDERARGEAFLCHWTLKEACGKALGTGLGVNLERFELAGVLAGEPRLLDPELAAISLRRWDALPELIGAVAAAPAL